RPTRPPRAARRRMEGRAGRRAAARRSARRSLKPLVRRWGDALRVAEGTQASSDQGGGAWRQRGHHFGFVLLLILTSLIFLLAAPEEDWARLTATLPHGLTLVAALRAARVRPVVLRFAVALVAIAIISSVA